MEQSEIFFYCYKNVWQIFEDYINSIINFLIKKFNYKVNLELYEVIDFNIDIKSKNKYIFIQCLTASIVHICNTRNCTNIYLINTEQLCRKYDNWCNMINNYPQNINYLDWTFENIKYYNNKNVKYLPYQVNYKEIKNYEKEFDICIIQPFQSEYRWNIINELRNKYNLNINIITGYGDERDDILFRHKIILNISYSPCANMLETIRCYRCVFNKMIVISDEKKDEKLLLKDYIIFEKYENMCDKIVYVLNNYNDIYNKLFNNFNLTDIEKQLEEYIDI